MTVPTSDADRIGRAIAITQERLRMPTLSRADAMDLVGCRSATSFDRFCKTHGITSAARCRYRRKELLRALECEAR